MVREYSLRQESSVQYLAPDAIAELKDFERKHRLKLLDNEGKLVGFAELVYFSKPISAYYLEYMRVTKERRGQGFGSELIEQVNAFLKEKGKMGILVDAIEEDQAALGMYLSHGWKETYIPDLLIFNESEGLSDDVIAALEKRITKWTDRVYEKSEEAGLVD